MWFCFSVYSISRLANSCCMNYPKDDMERTNSRNLIEIQSLFTLLTLDLDSSGQGLARYSFYCVGCEGGLYFTVNPTLSVSETSLKSEILERLTTKPWKCAEKVNTIRSWLLLPCFCLLYLQFHLFIIFQRAQLHRWLCHVHIFLLSLCCLCQLSHCYSLTSLCLCFSRW